MQNGNDTHETAAASAQLRDTKNGVAALPSDDAAAAAKQIAAALAAMNDKAALSQRERYDSICLLDAAAATHIGAVLQEYMNTLRHTRQRESELWNGAYNCLRELAAAYALCTLAHADQGQADAALSRVCAARAIRALRRQLQWLRARYAPPPPQIWQSLAAIVSHCEPAGIGDELVIYEGAKTTIQREFLKLLALAVLTGDNLMPLERELAIRLIERYVDDFVFSRSPESGCTHGFDLKHPQAPAPLGGALPAGADMRYFGAGAALASLEKALRALEQGAPAELGLTLPVEASLLAPVLQQIHRDWAGTPLERRQQREKTNVRISVLPGFGEIAREIDRSTADPFDFTAKAAGESWIASDFSPDGFGVVMPAVTGDWISVGSVLGIQEEAAGAWSVGMVRRVRRLDGGQQHIGVQVLCRHAQAVRVMREVTRAGLNMTQRMPVDLGILLSTDAAQPKEIVLLVSDAALYREGNLHVLAGDAVLLVALHEVLEVTADCARIRLNVLGVER